MAPEPGLIHWGGVQIGSPNYKLAHLLLFEPACRAEKPEIWIANAPELRAARKDGGRSPAPFALSIATLSMVPTPNCSWQRAHARKRPDAGTLARKDSDWTPHPSRSIRSAGVSSHLPADGTFAFDAGRLV